jgi:hypothetical protein
MPNLFPEPGITLATPQTLALGEAHIADADADADGATGGSPAIR